jgi:type IV pilus assembly protein PilW
MSPKVMHSQRHFEHRQRGLTLVEMMVAMTIGLFLLGGVMTIVAGTRATLATQTQLAQLQDNERLAMALVTDVVESAGYYPDPKNNTSSLFTITAPFANIGQSVFGTATASGPDTFTVRYATAPNDTVLNCVGGTNTGAVNPLIYVNAFSLSAQKELQCALNGAQPVPLVSGVRNLVVWYGVNTGTAKAPTLVDRYLRADQVTALALWNKVSSLKVQLTFTNPVNSAAPIQLTRIISVMNPAP